MKNVLSVLFFVSVILFAGCSDDDEGNEISLSKSDVVGVWNITAYSNGSNNFQNSPEGNIYIHLKSDNSYNVKFLTNNYIGTYTISGNKVIGTTIDPITEYFQFDKLEGKEAEISYNNSVNDKYKFKAIRSEEVAKALRLGDEYQGGKIFYLDESGTSGLIASTEDLSYDEGFGIQYGFIWGSDGIIGTNDNNGYENTKKMANIANSEGHAAYAFKNGYSYNGYNDWYIPSYNELELLKENKSYVGNFQNSTVSWSNYYWSSSESDANNALCLNFFALSGNYAEKYLMRKVRPIRKF